MPSATPAHKSAPALAVKALLRPDEGYVAADLAERAGIGQSTARKALAALEAAGCAHRVEQGTGKPVIWYATATTALEPAGDPPEEPHTAEPEDTAEHAEAAQGEEHGDQNEAATQEHDEAPSPGGGANGEGAPAAEGAEQPEPGTAPVRTRRSSVEGLTAPAVREGRLGHGELGVIVLEAFALNPGVAFTAPRLARLVARSSGAITNQLVKLCGEGTLTQVAETPATYADARAPKPA